MLYLTDPRDDECEVDTDSVYGYDRCSATSPTPTPSDAACELYDGGLNVFPTPRGSKEPYGRHTFLNTTRLWRGSLPGLLADRNIAVRTGRLSENLFVLDCDSYDTFDFVGEELKNRGINAWIRDGVDGGQYWLRSAEGEVANAHVKGVEVLGNRLYSMAPPSIHPEGMVYQWIAKDGELPPCVTIDELDFLGLSLVRKPRKAVATKVCELPPKADTILIGRDTTGYTSNSEAEYAACLSMIGAGFTDTEIEHVLKMFQPPHYVKIGDRNFTRSVLKPARKWHDSETEKFDKASDTPRASRFVAWAHSHPWSGRTGAVDKAVFLAMCERMKMESGMPFRASMREVAELANVDKMTVVRAIQRLIAGGLVEALPQAKPSKVTASKKGIVGACKYNLAVEEVKVTHTVGNTYVSVGDSVCNAFNTFRRPIASPTSCP